MLALGSVAFGLGPGPGDSRRAAKARPRPRPGDRAERRHLRPHRQTRARRAPRLGEPHARRLRRHQPLDEAGDRRRSRTAASGSTTASTCAAVGRALWADIRHQSVVEGGSTITQQFVKNVWVRDERSIGRKVREAALAWQLTRSKQWSKERILTAYLNTIYFGNGAYGVQQASLAYFGHGAAFLTLPEAALLAGIPAGPEPLRPRPEPALRARAPPHRAPGDAGAERHLPRRLRQGGRARHCRNRRTCACRAPRRARASTSSTTSRSS